MKVKMGYKARADSSWTYVVCQLSISSIAHEIARLLRMNVVQISLRKMED